LVPDGVIAPAKRFQSAPLCRGDVRICVRE